jgi:Meckel syndrome type 1 protein
MVPLAHVTLEGEGLPAQARSFVVGTPSPSGRVHPIALDVPPGGIPGLVAQAVAIPPRAASAAA